MNGRGVRAAAGALGAVLGAALAVNAVRVVRNLGALRPLRPGDPAPPLDLPGPRGGRVRMSDLRGRVVLLDFWARWCEPCVRMMPVLDDLHRQYQPRGFTVLGIRTDEGTSGALERVHYPVLLDDGSAARRYGVVSLPHLFLVGRDGVLRRVFWGYATASDLDGAVRAALREGWGVRSGARAP